MRVDARDELPTAIDRARVAESSFVRESSSSPLSRN
jgi:hypothetical protein